MITSRFTVALVTLGLLLTGPANGENHVRVFVPAGAYHGEQELIVGQPGEIYVEITNDVLAMVVVVGLSVDNPGGSRLWNPIPVSDVEFLLPDPLLKTHGYLESTQAGVWPDSLYLAGIALSTEQFLQPGTYPFVKLTVTPTAPGTVVVSGAEVRYNGETHFLVEGSVKVHPELVLPSINIIELPDCNANGVPDVQDLAEGTSLDCNLNGIPDECDIANGLEDDCNINGVPDICDLGYGTSQDCNLNLVPDECDVDLNLNGIPDDCEDFDDCNFNGVPDEDDIVAGTSTDSNGNDVPDECEGLAGNFVRIYVPPGQGHDSQELVVDQTGNIVIALVNDVEILTAALPFRFNSTDGTPLWAPFAEEDIELLTPSHPSDVASVYLTRQGGDWPDTLTVIRCLFNGEALPIGVHPILRMTAIPSVTGTVTWEAAPVPSAYLPPQFVTDGDMVTITVSLEAPPLTVRTCCSGRVGNVNLLGGDEPTIGDILMLVDHLFVSGVELPCILEADVDQSGGPCPSGDDITIGDITVLIDYLFVTGKDKMDLPECL